MDSKRLSGKLRDISRSTASNYKKQILKQAARRIEEQAAQLKKTKQWLLQLKKILPGLDGGCDMCDHGKKVKQCIENDELIQCAKCHYDCYCKDCGPEGNKWENSELSEVLSYDERQDTDPGVAPDLY